MDVTHYGLCGRLFSTRRAILTALDGLVVNNNVASKRNFSDIERDLRLVKGIADEFVMIDTMCF